MDPWLVRLVASLVFHRHQGEIARQGSEATEKTGNGRRAAITLGAVSALIGAGLAWGPAWAGGAVGPSCRLKGILLQGKVQVVTSFPDLKVQVVGSFPDLKVEAVSSFPDKCGKWQMVESFPDFKIQFVDSFPDLKIEFVSSFPGVP